MPQFLKKTDWEEWGNQSHNKGSINRVSIPLHWWLMDIWLEHVHTWYKKIPGWHSFWGKVNPNWGDPFCAAYCFTWSNFYWKKRVEEYKVEVGYDNLSDDFKKDYERDF